MIDGASFRDPAGQVHHADGRVFRTVQPDGLADYRFVRDTGALVPLIESGAVLGAEEVDAGILGDAAPAGGLVVERPRIPFWFYPYEWPFGALKAAALAHLDIQIELLDRDVALSDASAYNLQFTGAGQVFSTGVSCCHAVDAVVALAFVHHNAVGRNIPLPEIVRWIMALAPCGLIEFVHQDDNAVARMLALHEGISGTYSFKVFLDSLQDRAPVVEHRAVSPS